jgi:hypothetical protein
MPSLGWGDPSVGCLGRETLRLETDRTDRAIATVNKAFACLVLPHLINVIRDTHGMHTDPNFPVETSTGPVRV